MRDAEIRARRRDARATQTYARNAEYARDAKIRVRRRDTRATERDARDAEIRLSIRVDRCVK